MDDSTKHEMEWMTSHLLTPVSPYFNFDSTSFSLPPSSTPSSDDKMRARAFAKGILRHSSTTTTTTTTTSTTTTTTTTPPPPPTTTTAPVSTSCHFREFDFLDDSGKPCYTNIIFYFLLTLAACAMLSFLTYLFCKVLTMAQKAGHACNLCYAMTQSLRYPIYRFCPTRTRERGGEEEGGGQENEEERKEQATTSASVAGTVTEEETR